MVALSVNNASERNPTKLAGLLLQAASGNKNGTAKVFPNLKKHPCEQD